MQVESEENRMMTRDEALSRLTTLTAGRAAEELVLGLCSSGAANDIEQATRLARSMVTRLGMSEEFGMMALENHIQPIPGRRPSAGMLPPIPLRG